MTNAGAFADLCPGCFADKGNVVVCPHCGYDESLKRGPLVLAHRTLLHNGQYLIGRVLGKPGGFGITYLALDTKLETRVAIKEYLPRDLAGRDAGHATISAHSAEDGDFFRYGLTQFLQEARTLAQFDHANIVRVRNFFEENGTGYLVMDYYDGVTLGDYLAQQAQGRLPEATAIGILMPILDGLREVHAKNFLHRDIKPQNIYLTTGKRPILLDFGAARQAMSERSRSLSVVLSEGYAPYEQYHRRGEQGPWTDIYACAAVLYHAVAGEAPPPATERMHKDELDIAGMGLSASLTNALQLGLAADHQYRPQRMTEFQALLLGGSEASAAKQVKSEPKTADLHAPATIDVNIESSFDPDTSRSQLSEKTWRGFTSAVIIVAVCFFSILTPALSLLIYIVFVLVRIAKKAIKKRDGASVDPTKKWWGPTWVLSFIIAGFFTHSFLVVPSRVSGGGMAPTLLASDFVLVNKFTYGIRLPLINKKIVDVTPPHRGDVTVFRYPPDPSLDRIGRVVGLPGDKLVYRNKLLTINGQKMPQTKADDYLDPDSHRYTPRFTEQLGNVEHQILIETDAPAFVPQIDGFPYRENCTYPVDGIECQVPAGHYFMMGDNRDNSHDSRYWGFVPDANVVGKIFLIWMNVYKTERVGTSIN